jgi:hypothetical protein
VLPLLTRLQAIASTTHSYIKSMNYATSTNPRSSR